MFRRVRNGCFAGTPIRGSGAPASSPQKFSRVPSSRGMGALATLLLQLTVASTSSRTLLSAQQADPPTGSPPPFPWIVDITTDELDDTRVRWASLAGLLNREAPRVAPLVGWKGFRKWVPFLEASRGLRFSNVSRADFYHSARAAVPQLVQRKISYSWAEREWALPTVLTLCGIHQAVAVAAEFDDAPELSTVLNVSGRWNSAAAASRYLLQQRQQGALPAHFTSQSLMVLQHPGLLGQGMNADLVVANGLWAFWFDGICPNTTGSVRIRCAACLRLDKVPLSSCGCSMSEAHARRGRGRMAPTAPRTPSSSVRSRKAKGRQARVVLSRC